MSLKADHSYRRLRKHIRTADRTDALLRIWAFSNFFSDKNFPVSNFVDIPDVLKRNGLASGLFSPWEAFELAREVILHGETQMQPSALASRWPFWEKAIFLSREVEKSVDEKDISSQNVLVAVNRLMRRQTPWQNRRNELTDFYRAILIYGNNGVEHFVSDRFKLSPQKLFFLSWLFYIHFSERAVIDEDKLSIDFATKEEVDAYLSFFARPIDQLRCELRGELCAANTYCYRYAALQSSPIVRVRHGGKSLLACPVPQLLPRRLYSGIYYELIGTEPAFANAYGAAFRDLIANYSKHVLTRFIVHDEAPYYRGKLEHRTCDLILHEVGSDIVFVECKAKRITEKARISVNLNDDLNSDLDKFADAAAQLIKSIEDFRDGLYPQANFHPSERLHGVVVVPEDLFITGSVMRNELIKRTAQKITTRLRNPSNPPIPVTNVEFISIREYEKFATLLERLGATAIFEKRHLPEYRDWGFSNFMDHAFGQKAVSDLQFYTSVETKVQTALAST